MCEKETDMKRKPLIVLALVLIALTVFSCATERDASAEKPTCPAVELLEGDSCTLRLELIVEDENWQDEYSVYKKGDTVTFNAWSQSFMIIKKDLTYTLSADPQIKQYTVGRGAFPYTYDFLFIKAGDISVKNVREDGDRTVYECQRKKCDGLYDVGYEFVYEKDELKTLSFTATRRTDVPYYNDLHFDFKVLELSANVPSDVPFEVPADYVIDPEYKEQYGSLLEELGVI